jgi:alanyl-tRNA synthetase
LSAIDNSKKWTGSSIRRAFLDYFAAHEHRELKSSSLVPVNDPTLLFTNAGMNQFKDVFLGLDKREYKRATTSQKCVRAGGKHNDLENVGFTNRHHTFFEMLGNFSFGDYFKKDAVAFAWELITSKDYFALPIENLYFTVFGGAELGGVQIPTDEEAAAHWLAIGAPKDRILRIPGLKENFWAMGDTGPCGPCSEIHFDLGATASDAGHADCKFPCDCGRYMEIWNLVFMQFNRDTTGALNPLPKPSVDTGMGLERMAAVLEGVVSNYDTDLFQPLMIAAAQHAGVDPKNSELQPSLRIVADHSRAATFLISDGVIPSNEGRGDVLRKIIRRGLRHAEKLNANIPRPFLSFMAGQVRELMRDAYPELAESAQRVDAILDSEERRFSRTVQIGMKQLDQDLAPILLERADRDLTTAIERELDDATVYPGDKAFRLYDTFGLPRDFIEDVARDAGIKVDWEGFDRAMTEQRTRARASWKGAHKDIANPAFAKLAETFKTEPDFYYGSTVKDARIEAIITKNGPVNEIRAGEEAEIVLDRTSIYSESGGQVADTGTFYDASENMLLAEVRGAYYPVSGLIAHRIVAREPLHVGDRVATIADATRREHIKRNHSSTHMMNAALRNILGTHVKQAGSLVEPGRLRFDFSHFAPVDAAELRDVEQQVNEEIRVNTELVTDIMPIDQALASGALAFFGDRYPESNVRVVTIPDPHSPKGFYSKELCGGTHVKHGGDIGVFKIIGESSVAAGVRRIEAVTGTRAIEEYQNAAATLTSLASLLNTDPENIQEAAQKLIETRKQLEKQLDAVRNKATQGQAGDLAAQARDIKGVKVISAMVPDASREALRSLVDSLRQKLGSGVVFLGTMEPGENPKPSLIGGVTKDLTGKLHAGKIVQEITKEVGGKGGGRPDLAEGGTQDTTGLKRALELVYAVVDRLL